MRRSWAAPVQTLGFLLTALLLVAGSALSQPSDGPLPAPRFPTAGEPITPIAAPPEADPRKLALGERLFQDPQLSHGATRSCLSCHDTRTSGASGRRLDLALDGSELPVNTSTVFNAALSFRLNWDGNLRSLEAQAEASLESPRIMGESVAEVVGRLRADPTLSRQFVDAYGHAPDRASLLDAIATYERSLVTPDSRFDRWLGGDATALSAEEQEGYRLFKTLGCVSCHQGVNIGGNLYERPGVFRQLAASNPKILRVPSLRNVAATPPYFHDGSAPTLTDAVKKMAAAQLDWSPSDQQVAAIVAFLQTLTGIYRGKTLIGAGP